MSNSKKLPDLSEKSVESINSGDSRLVANLNINCSEVRRLMNNSSDLISSIFRLTVTGWRLSPARV